MERFKFSWTNGTGNKFMQSHAASILECFQSIYKIEGIDFGQKQILHEFIRKDPHEFTMAPKISFMLRMKCMCNQMRDGIVPCGVVLPKHGFGFLPCPSQVKSHRILFFAIRDN